MPTTEAQILHVEEKESGYARLELDGRPRFLDTKRRDLIELAYQLLDEGSVNILEYTEMESRNINQATGKPYTNRYFEGLASNGREPRRQETRQTETRRQTPEPRRPEPERERQPTYGYETNPVNAWRMALTSGSERAVQTLPLMPTEQRDFETQKQIALAWALWIVNTPQPAEPEDDDIPY